MNPQAIITSFPFIRLRLERTRTQISYHPVEMLLIERKSMMTCVNALQHLFPFQTIYD